MQRLARLSSGLLILSVCGAHRCLGAAEHRIEMFQGSFLPQEITVNLDDIVVWLHLAGDHTVTSGVPDGAPGTPDEPGAYFDGVVNEASPSFSHAFTEFRTGYSFFCRHHPSQIGFIGISGGEVSVRVGVVDNVFSPEEVFLFEGDSVRWEHEPMEDLHSVTSGLSSRPEDNPGALFDEESSDDRPIFIYQFNESGRFPYFCIPHEDLAMKGVVHVEERFVRGDSSGEGKVDISDAVGTLNYLFLGEAARCCRDALDSNDDGQINIGDPIFTLNFLFLGGAKIPPPFPRPGADRTADPLDCCLPRG